MGGEYEKWEIMEVHCDKGGRGLWEVILDCLNIRIREIQVESGGRYRFGDFYLGYDGGEVNRYRCKMNIITI